VAGITGQPAQQLKCENRASGTTRYFLRRTDREAVIDNTQDHKLSALVHTGRNCILPVRRSAIRGGRASPRAGKTCFNQRTYFCARSQNVRGFANKKIAGTRSLPRWIALGSLRGRERSASRGARNEAQSSAGRIWAKSCELWPQFSSFSSSTIKIISGDRSESNRLRFQSPNTSRTTKPEREMKSSTWVRDRNRSVLLVVSVTS
jgi:hypothetical protein